MKQTVQQERRVHIIPATRSTTTAGQATGRKQRVAAYCRVSTDSEEQLTSYTAQKAYYTQKIGENPDCHYGAGDARNANLAFIPGRSE